MVPIVFLIEGQNGKVIASEKQTKTDTISVQIIVNFISEMYVLNRRVSHSF